MTINYEPIVKHYYNGLEEGKILGRKCKECGTVEFPPVRICNECSSSDTEWVEISGNAKLLDFTYPGVLAHKENMQEYMPYVFGNVQIEEGPSFLAVIRGISKNEKAAVNAMLPAPIKAVIVQRDGYKTVFFEYINK